MVIPFLYWPGLSVASFSLRVRATWSSMTSSRCFPMSILPFLCILGTIKSRECLFIYNLVWFGKCWLDSFIKGDISTLSSWSFLLLIFVGRSCILFIRINPSNLVPHKVFFPVFMLFQLFVSAYLLLVHHFVLSNIDVVVLFFLWRLIVLVLLNFLLWFLLFFFLLVGLNIELAWVCYLHSLGGGFLLLLLLLLGLSLKEGVKIIRLSLSTHGYALAKVFVCTLFYYLIIVSR